MTLLLTLAAKAMMILLFLTLSLKYSAYSQHNANADTSILQEVIITNNSAHNKVRRVQMGEEMVTSLEAKNLPAILGEVDIVKILQLKPGVKNAGEGLAGFYVRGGGADQNFVTLDGIPIYNANHLLGLFSIFNNATLLI